MESRLKSSTKWTSYPEELTIQIEEVFREFFEEYDLKGGVFKAEGAIYPEEIVLRVGLAVPKELRRDNFEVSCKFDPEKEKATDVIQTLSDALGIIWEDHLEEGASLTELPLIWQPYTENSTIFYRYTSINSDLEKEADRILDEYNKQLIYGEDNIDENSQEPVEDEEESPLH